MFQNLAHLLCEMRDVNKSLQFEVDDLKQKLQDAQGMQRIGQLGLFSDISHRFLFIFVCVKIFLRSFLLKMIVKV